MIKLRIWSSICALMVVSCAAMPIRPSVLTTASLAQIPATTYAIAPANAEVGFAVKPFALPRIEGAFSQFDGHVTVSDAAAGQVSLTANVVLDTVDIPNEAYENLVKSPGWFDTAQYPTALFVGELNGWSADGTGVVRGSMTIRDVTRDEAFIITLTCDGIERCPGQAVGFRGDITISRAAYGMTRLPGVVGDDVQLSVSGTLTPDILQTD